MFLLEKHHLGGGKEPVTGGEGGDGVGVLGEAGTPL